MRMHALRNEETDDVVKREDTHNQENESELYHLDEDAAMLVLRLRLRPPGLR